MRTISTVSGKTFPELWDGISTIDGALRISIVDATVDDVHNAFKSPEETETLVRDIDGAQSVYTGFTKYRGFQVLASGEIVVTLTAE